MPQGLKKTALKLNYDLPSSGHWGMDRTNARIKEKIFWYGLGKDYVATRPTRNQNKKATAYGRVPMQEYQAGATMERVHLDFLQPLPRTPKGNEYVLMMVDQFTRWVECVHLPSQTAEIPVKAAVDVFSPDLVTHTKSSQTKAETLSQSYSARYVKHWRYTRQGPHPINQQ